MRWALIWTAHAANLALLGYQTWLLCRASGRTGQPIVLMLFAYVSGAASMGAYRSWRMRRHLTRISHLAAERRRKYVSINRPRETPGADNL